MRRILEVDEDLPPCSSGATFLIAIATELFIQHLAARSLDMARAERKPRKNIQYADVANAVARLDALEFLSDVVPRTTTFKQYAEERGEDHVPGSDLQVPTPEALRAMREEAEAAAAAEPTLAGPSRNPRTIFGLDQPMIQQQQQQQQQQVVQQQRQELQQHQQLQQQQMRPMVSLPPPPGFAEQLQHMQMQRDEYHRRKQSMEMDPMQLDPRRRSLEVAQPPPHASPVRQQLPFELSGVDRIRVVLPPPTPTVLPPEYRR